MHTHLCIHIHTYTHILRWFNGACHIWIATAYLESSDELVAVQRYHSVVMVPGGEQSRWVPACLLRHIVHWGVGLQSLRVFACDMCVSIWHVAHNM